MVLKSGQSTHQVKNLQQQLERLGYSVGRLGLPFNTQLENIVKAFQAEQGLPVDGVVGEITQLKLQQAIAELELLANSQKSPIPQPPQINNSGDFLQGNWLEWRVITTKKLNARSGPGFEYKIDLRLTPETTFSPHPDYYYPLKFDQVGKPWLVISYQGGAFFVRANSKFIEPVTSC
ncbi:peptidoglycan-binding protein [Lyngbya sp. PCC 8106]|uniref:peptidoglycan-binding domain-containing protein n=1 Tax=Lyngbya sp. (strain PCC 8106) TaxID=313612 RepID=UPI0000EAC6CB|nr:peptidoglycan-binding domain-containing protein [Lyngbya sp. PCC 8106]EAW34710.1 hypothetical protein L8106_25370 [Lyngbya sp. PCC 8106]